MNQRYIVVEPFCGMAGLSFYLMGGKPPISWMGSKVGYSETLAAILGLSRTNVAGFVWGDVGPNVAALAHLCGATGATAEDVAGWVLNSAWCPQGRYMGPDRPSNHRILDPEWTASITANGLQERVESLPLPATKAVANLIRSWKNEEPRALWERLKAKGWPSLLLSEGSPGRWLGPAKVEDVAAWVLTRAWVHPTGENFAPTKAKDRMVAAKDGTLHKFVAVTPETQAVTVESLPIFPPIACWQGRAEDLVLPADLAGFVCFVDGPYHGDGSKKITGYKHGTCSREAQLGLCRDYDRRGAVVAICESVRLDAELGPGWYAVEISHARKGQVRSFTRNQGGNRKEPQEWVTMNRPPQYHPPKQIGMFG